MASSLEEIIRALGALPQVEREFVEAEALKATEHLRWLPNPGPQTLAYYSEADEVLFGGQAGGGKSELGLGLAINCHQRSLILREFKDDARELGERLVQIVGSSAGWNGQYCVYKTPSRNITFDGLPNEKDKQRHKGRARDLIVWDELPDFYESQYDFVNGWNRSTDPAQRSRIIATGNPPTRAKGMWVIKRWAPWLDPRHSKPAKDGELRWYLRNSEGEEIEVEGPGPFDVGGVSTLAKSRTFIRSKLSDNPDLATSGYDATLARMPKELRDAYRGGKFDASLRDDPWQVIPTQWVLDAQRRWRENPRPPPGVPMCAIGVDPAQGGIDRSVLAPRYDHFYPALKVVPGKDTPLGSDVAGLVVAMRRDNADIVLDMGGGYGSGCYQTLRENEIAVQCHKGSEKSSARSRDGKLGFYNKRSQVYWQFREALDPDQPGGSPIALPDDPEILGDLTVLTYEVNSRGIQVLAKEEASDLIGRSPDKGDAIVMSWSAGLRGISPSGAYGREQIARLKRTPKVDLGPRRRF